MILKEADRIQDLILSQHPRSILNVKIGEEAGFEVKEVLTPTFEGVCAPGGSPGAFGCAAETSPGPVAEVSEDIYVVTTGALGKSEETRSSGGFKEM